MRKYQLNKKYAVTTTEIQNSWFFVNFGDHPVDNRIHHLLSKPNLANITKVIEIFQFRHILMIPAGLTSRKVSKNRKKIMKIICLMNQKIKKTYKFLVPSSEGFSSSVDTFSSESFELIIDQPWHKIKFQNKIESFL